MIPFNKPCEIGKEQPAMQQAIKNGKISGNGPFGKKCSSWLENNLECTKALLTPSCTAALEMTALLTNTKHGDEIIMPSYTFVSTANAFVLRGAAIRFVDIEPETMNISPNAIEAAITEKTTAIVVVHYAGVACDMKAIMEIADHYGLWVVEDAAQGIQSTYNGEPLGTIGHFGTLSFHETKNITSGEGGALLINNQEAADRAEIIQEKGTDRSQFFKGIVDKYSWRDLGSSYVLSELNAAYLSVQFEHAAMVTSNRLETWNYYYNSLRSLDVITLPHVPENCMHNAHMFYLKTDNQSALIDFLKQHGIMAVTHYVPLHTSEAGKKFGEFIGPDNYTTRESEKIVRLPLYYGIGKEDVDYVVRCIKKFFEV